MHLFLRLKIEGLLILCIVIVVAKTCFEKLIAPKVLRLVHDLLPVKTRVRHISQTIRRIEKIIFWPEIHLVYIYILRKS